MGKSERILRPVKRIHGGISLPHNKNTAEVESVPMPVPQSVCIPLLQHIGAPCEPAVKKGDEVFVGTLIGSSESFVSAPVHSSVSGKVTDITERKLAGKSVKCVVIEADGNQTPDPFLEPFEVKSGADIAEAAKRCGLVGLGGAGFPTHVKLSPSKDAKIDTLIVNGAECEPYITADNRECIERYEDIVNGVYLLKEKLGLERVVICIENNKPKAISKLYRMATDHRDFDDRVKLMCLPSKYPQGAEKVLIYSATGRKLPIGKLPSDVGCIVMNITGIGVLYRYITTGMPLVSKRITVDGTAVSEPKNIIAPIGTSIKDLLRFAGADTAECERLITGGPMMGSAQYDENAVVEKRTNAVLLQKAAKPQSQTACIRCGRCASACPMKLYPASVEAVLRCGQKEKLTSLNVNYCMECGSCSYVCPAKRPLTQVMRVAKDELRRNKK